MVSEQLRRNVGLLLTVSGGMLLGLGWARLGDWEPVQLGVWAEMATIVGLLFFGVITKSVFSVSSSKAVHAAMLLALAAGCGAEALFLGISIDSFILISSPQDLPRWAAISALPTGAIFLFLGVGNLLE